MADPVDRLIGLLELEQTGPDEFTVPNRAAAYTERVFGGQVAAQALRAALHTVDEERHPHSMHAYFLRPGVPGQPIRYEVDRIRDGRSFLTRRVVAWQDEPIFTSAVSFHRVEPGPDYQQPIADDVPGPDEAEDVPGIVPAEVRDRLPMEFKELGPTPPDGRGYHRSSRRAWMRIRRRLPDDRDLHLAALAFLSDMGALVAARPPIDALPLDRLMGASLDHAIWFHRPIRADEWFLYDLRSVSAGNARGLAVGTMHAADGTLGASVVQEALLRLVDPDRATRPPSLSDEAEAASS